MRDENAHLSDDKLILFADGEIHAGEESAIRVHLAACPSCRLRMSRLDDALAEVSRMQPELPASPLPPADGPRALLQARLREIPAPNRRPILQIASIAAMLALAALVWLNMRPGERTFIPRADLTPGVVRPVAATDVCHARLNDNAEVVPAVQRQVFAEYGMPDAEARAYEVDYLITPALGGSDDIRNLWPQPYSGSPWNAHIKDALEDRLWRMVCAGQIDLPTAQREIAANWVAAYKKYFHTPQPLPQHQRFRREDEPE